jgi:hypothetical protein
MSDKIIVTNKSALKAKYGAAGLTAIQSAVSKLIAADKKRKITGQLVYLDDAAAMKKMGGTAVTVAASPRQNKKAIDSICKKAEPDYLVILGAIDVVPHQDLKNPAHSADDEDAQAYGDLPYACDAPYSTDIARFVGPTRVVGRIPDLVGANRPTYLLGLLKTATGFVSRPAKDYENYFGLSTDEWKASSSMSLEGVFGNSTRLVLSPKDGPNHTAAVLKPLAHFINCHGGSSSPVFQGQKGGSYPESLTSKLIDGKIGEGTVASVECCYGAELYDSITLGLDLPICQNYLQQGAYGYFGSTTIAYGPADANGAADLICQYFLKEVRDGASTGRAALTARQKFVEQTGQMDPIDLKTLGQFCLLGDPGITPVATMAGQDASKGAAVAEDDVRFARAERRVGLREKGLFLAKTKPTASKPIPDSKPAPKAKAALESIAKKAGLGGKETFRAFAVNTKSSKKTAGGKAASAPTRYFLTVGSREKPVPPKVNAGVAVVAKEVNGTIVGYRIYEQR